MKSSSEKKVRILLVDDEQDFLEVAEKFLSRKWEGLEVESVTSAEEAYDTISEGGFSAVIADYHMSGMDG
ncbi:MAG: response regulator, partial [Candidatus Aenigmatarchaeota archaeon]